MNTTRRNLFRIVISGAALAAIPAAANRAWAQVARLLPMQEHRYARANYIPDAPLRSVVGDGKVLNGTVVSTADGSPVAGARVEFWLNTTPNGGDRGEQNPVNRGTTFTDENGRFRIQSDPPAPVYANTVPHIHTRVTADGHSEFYYRHVTDNAVVDEDAEVILEATT